MATHSSILAQRIPWTEELGGYSSWGHEESDRTEHLSPALQADSLPSETPGKPCTELPSVTYRPPHPLPQCSPHSAPSARRKADALRSADGLTERESL